MLLILGAVAGGAVPVHQQSCVAQGIANSKKGVVCPRTQPCRSRPQEVLNHSDHHPVLFLSNLVEGTYTFHLKVTDAKGESDTDRTTVEVKPGELSLPGPREGRSAQSHTAVVSDRACAATPSLLYMTEESSSGFHRSLSTGILSQGVSSASNAETGYVCKLTLRLYLTIQGR